MEIKKNGGCHIAWKLVFSRSQGRPFKRKTLASRLFFDAGNIDSFSIINTPAHYMDREKVKNPDPESPVLISPQIGTIYLICQPE